MRLFVCLAALIAIVSGCQQSSDSQTTLEVVLSDPTAEELSHGHELLRLGPALVSGDSMTINFRSGFDSLTVIVTTSTGRTTKVGTQVTHLGQPATLVLRDSIITRGILAVSVKPGSAGVPIRIPTTF